MGILWYSLILWCILVFRQTPYQHILKPAGRRANNIISKLIYVHLYTLNSYWHLKVTLRARIWIYILSQKRLVIGQNKLCVLNALYMYIHTFWHFKVTSRSHIWTYYLSEQLIYATDKIQTATNVRKKYDGEYVIDDGYWAIERAFAVAFKMTHSCWCFSYSKI